MIKLEAVRKSQAASQLDLHEDESRHGLEVGK